MGHAITIDRHIKKKDKKRGEKNIEVGKSEEEVRTNTGR